ncbi:MAG: DNA repair exonuclease [Planctomycetaceae bacterium]|nr:DNA repair exonuclease [Planctomycetaceae bacterium]
MSNRPFRFVHASDFHLERPLMGVADVPDHLRDAFIDAPYTAAKKLFDVALAEDADFVVLSGNLLDPHRTGPRGPLFLVEQFRRLAEREIPVYWAGGSSDPPESWPAVFELPKNVHVFTRGRVEDFAILQDDVPIARLSGVSNDTQRPLRPNDFSPDPTGLFSIAAAHGDADPSVISSRGLSYWALGGRHDRSTPHSGPQMIHYCGSPQGRRPEESGPHGCTLVQVDEQRQARTVLIPTDAARWLNERIVVDDSHSREDLQSQMDARIETLLEAAPGVLLLISWTVAGHGPLIAPLRRGALAEPLLVGLRARFGAEGRTSLAWSVSLDVELSETLPPEWYEQETIRGDFLRAVRQLQMNPSEPIALESYLSEAHRAGTLGTEATALSKTARDRLLREVASLGVDLLSGEEGPA